MPPAPLRPCTQPRCPALTRDRSGRCPAHPRKPDPIREAARDLRRGSAHARGYGRRWRKIRDAYIAAHPLCEHCSALGLVTPAVDVDHIIPLSDGGRIDGALQALCRPCHVRKTAADAVRRRRVAPSGEGDGPATPDGGGAGRKAGV